MGPNPLSETNDIRSKELFLDALDLPSKERDTFLERACDGDASLRTRVESLIAAHERSNDLEQLAATPGAALDPGQLATPPRLTNAEPPLALVSDYELLEELGRGAAGPSTAPGRPASDAKLR